MFGILRKNAGSPPPFLPQSAALRSALSTGLFFTGAEVSDGTCTYVVDCSGLLGSARSGMAQAGKSSSPFSAF